MTEKVMFSTPRYYTRKPLPGKAKWTKALRSMEFNQGKLTLCIGGKYCCLGVLSHIQGRLIEVSISGLPESTKEALLEGHDVIPDHLYIDGNEGVKDYVDSFGKLRGSNPLYEFIGGGGNLPRGCRVAIDGIFFGKLAALNDNGLTFAQIADVIDALWYDPEVENHYNYTPVGYDNSIINLL